MRPTVSTAVITSCGTLLAGLVVAAPGAAAVSVDQRFTVPSNGSFAIVGHGYGHGHGMGQYGAEGAARRGLTHRQILAFYYPGTKVAKVGGRIRVLVTADTSRDVVVLPTKGLQVRDRATGATYSLPADSSIRKWRLDVADGRTVVEKYTGSWHRYRSGGRAALAGDGEFLNPARMLTLLTPSGTRRYRGTLRAAAPYAGSSDRDTVNVLSVNNYVKGVVPAEMPATWSAEAVQSQAVAARTYGLWSRRSRLDRSWQICDTTSCQVYRGVDGEHPASNAAVEATLGQYLEYGGKPAFTQFSASSGGWTSAGSAPYLVAKEDPYDDWSGNGVHDWRVRVSEGRAERRYPGIGDLRSIRVTSREGGGEWKGRVASLTLVGSRGRRTLSGPEFRSLYDLRSAWVSFRR